MSANPLLTLVSTDCARCGATQETVQRDREIRPAAVCCELEDLIRMDPREPYGDDERLDVVLPEVECFYCGCFTHDPFRLGGHEFCSKGCGGDYAE